ncbi:MAG: DMT family transporter [Cyanobacteriota bacterium]|nr:DMT family transporter [Cyanobacteriota bacterium]
MLPSVISPSWAAAAGLSAALCWTVASLLWRRLPTSLPAVQLNLLKNLLALALQLLFILALPWQASSRAVLLLAASGVLGIALGDSLFFAALRRLGTRRTLTIDAGGPAVTTLAGVAWLGEIPGARQLLGVALISLAVLLVARRPEPETGHPPPGAAPPGCADPRLGVALALGALASGSLGALLARAALLEGSLPPLQAASIRLAAASLALLPVLPGLPRRIRRLRVRDPRWPGLLLATLLGTSAGISLQQSALAGLPGGLAVSLLSTAPVMALPLAWWFEGDRPGWRGLLAAGCALAGVALVVISRAAPAAPG